MFDRLVHVRIGELVRDQNRVLDLAIRVEPRIEIDQYSAFDVGRSQRTGGNHRNDRTPPRRAGTGQRCRGDHRMRAEQVDAREVERTEELFGRLAAGEAEETLLPRPPGDPAPLEEFPKN